ncbi:inactive protein RESTRICTED TEV MOVEMENT 2-like [Amaranthus tricolor]|uniref:inactive protein RESTRICTED TEV MOVEMENT 2-like n=1 Tax=Amaranthus tricolor TaxID=29722 RepID=UPI0025903549|nr:inactive protein RESTRICTED TEV MOVEMENT 2-like [Amaranthus tricolor]
MIIFHHNHQSIQITKVNNINKPEDAIAMANSQPSYEEFTPISDFISEKECDSLLIYLPGFTKDQLKVQLTTSGILRVTGERPIGDNKRKRFRMEFPVSSNINTKEMTAKFEGGKLYIRQPKLITPAATEQQQEEKPAMEAPKPQQQELQPASQPQQDVHSEEKNDKEEEKENDEEKKKSKLEEINRQIKGKSELFKELRKPEKLKKLAVYCILLLILGFNIIKMLKSFSKAKQQSVLEYDHQEL